MATPSQQMPSWLHAAFVLPNKLYTVGAGRVLGHRLVRLTHTGRTSGREFHVVVEVVRYDRGTGEAVVVSGFGRSADWFRNITAGGPAYVDFGSGPRRAAHRVLDTDEAITVFVDYERRNRAFMPLFRPVLSRLLGWTYDGSDDARRRLVEDLPMLALRPAP
jgi:deazaflavin-dependent oxidoreductase (nitroreductase family)